MRRLTFGEKHPISMQAGCPEANLNSTVFVIDDDPAVLSSLRFSLEIDGFSVRGYLTGTDLLAATDWSGCGCLVIDYYLAEMDGLELLNRLRTRGIVAPAILITSHPNLMLRQRAAAAGAPIVEKPFLGNTLVDAIRSALSPESETRSGAS